MRLLVFWGFMKDLSYLIISVCRCLKGFRGGLIYFPIADRIIAKFDCWFERHLLMVDRLCLVKSVIISLATHWMMVY